MSRLAINNNLNPILWIEHIQTFLARGPHKPSHNSSRSGHLT